MEKDKKKIKKNYRTPRLTVYGNLKKITQAVGHTGLGDGGTGSARRTG